VRGRGPSAPEKKLGADGLGIVSIKTAGADLEGYFLFQAKKAAGNSSSLRGSKSECTKMLFHSPASYLLVLMPSEVKMVGAMAVDAIQVGDPSLHELPFVSYPRFITEHVLHGLMLEPLKSLRKTMTSDLQAEIKYVIAISGGTARTVEQAMLSLDKELRDLDLEFDAFLDR
jgi:hypothetical protein